MNTINDSADALTYYYSQLKHLRDDYNIDPIVTSKPRVTVKVSQVKRKFQYIARD